MAPKRVAIPASESLSPARGARIVYLPGEIAAPSRENATNHIDQWASRPSRTVAEGYAISILEPDAGLQLVGDEVEFSGDGAICLG